MKPIPPISRRKRGHEFKTLQKFECGVVVYNIGSKNAKKIHNKTKKNGLANELNESCAAREKVVQQQWVHKNYKTTSPLQYPQSNK